jgi:hypothetical protein
LTLRASAAFGVCAFTVAQILTQLGAMMVKQSTDAQKVILQLIEKQ